jgi:peptide/nickel transport system permease protein
MAELDFIVGSEVPVPSGASRHRIGVYLSLAVLMSVILCALFGSILQPYDPMQQNLDKIMVGPTHDYLLGTDNLGRDLLSRIIFGARTALAGPLFVAVVGMLPGVVLGLVAGYFAGWVDSAISRWIDVMYALPSLLIAIVVVGASGGGYWIGVFVLTFLFVPFNARIVRSAVIQQRVSAYIESAKVLGIRPSRILFRHILPNCLPLVASTVLLDFGFALVSLAGLAFLGLGVSPGVPDWGLMISEGMGFVFQSPLVVIVPTLAILFTSVSVNYIGDYVFETWTARRESR